MSRRRWTRLGSAPAGYIGRVALMGKRNSEQLARLQANFAEQVLRIDWLGERMHVTPVLAAAVVTKLAGEGLIEETMMTSRGRTTYRVTDRGRAHASEGNR